MLNSYNLLMSWKVTKQTMFASHVFCGSYGKIWFEPTKSNISNSKPKATMWQQILQDFSKLHIYTPEDCNIETWKWWCWFKWFSFSKGSFRIRWSMLSFQGVESRALGTYNFGRRCGCVMSCSNNNLPRGLHRWQLVGTSGSPLPPKRKAESRSHRGSACGVPIDVLFEGHYLL